MIEKVSVSQLVDFRRIEKPTSKITFVKNLSKSKDKQKDDGGGDYWICSTSASANTFWTKDKLLLEDKIQELEGKIEIFERKQTKDQFQKNIDILVAMNDFDFGIITPNGELVKQSLKKNIISIQAIPVQIRPQHIFSYEIDEIPHIGGVWFVAKKGGFKNAELGMFTTALYKYLDKRYGDEFTPDPNYCSVIDITGVQSVNYTDVLKGKVPNILDPTIIDIVALLG